MPSNASLQYVSLHIPKTGGSTFTKILLQKFGPGLQLAYHPKYGIPIIENPVCIHGHGVFEFFSDLIVGAKHAQWITFLRDPLRSAISHYYYTKKWSPVNDRGEPQEFDDRGLDVWLTHQEEFRWPNPPGYNHNRYSKWFDKRQIQDYDFVGLTDRFDESLVLLYRQFGWDPLCYSKANVGGYRPPELNDATVATFRQLNGDDYRIYDYAGKRLEEAKQAYGASFQRDLAAFRKCVQECGNSEPAAPGDGEGAAPEP